MTTKITKRNSVIAFAVIALIVGGVLVGLEGCENPAESGLALGGLGEQSVNSGPNNGGPTLTITWGGKTHNNETLAWLPSTAPLGLTAGIANPPADPKVRWTISGDADVMKFDGYTAGSLVAPANTVTIKPGANSGTVTVQAALEGYPEATESFTINRPPYVIADPTSDDLTVMFGRRVAGEPLTQDIIEATFADLHKLISSPVDDFTTIITTSKYIDLLSLNVKGHPTDAPDEGFSSSAGYGMGQINISNTPRIANEPLRLKVVGVNSFNTGNVAANNDDTSHVVFMFKNSPGTRRMDDTPDNSNGYGGTEMHDYLTGNFLEGLKAAAGLTPDMLWTPTRKVANHGNNATSAATIEDTLWLPTLWEVDGDNGGVASDWEDDTNQVVLGYYPANGWLASPAESNSTDFCLFDGGTASVDSANAVKDFAPAFCVR